MLSLIAAAVLAQPWTLASEYEKLTLTTGAAHTTTYLVSYTENGQAKTASGSVSAAAGTVMLTGAAKPSGNTTRLRIVTAVRIVNTTDQDQTVSIQLLSNGVTTTPLPTTLLTDYAVATLPVTGISVLQDEGVPVTSRTTVNFTGAGVSCADNSGLGRTDCTITGGSGGGGGPAPPVDAGYVVWGANSTGSTNERALSNGDNTTIDTGTSGVVKVNVSGTLPQARGGMGVASLSCAAGAYVTCNGTVCSCATPANFVEQSIAITSVGLFFQQTVTGQAWVTGTSKIVCSVFGTDADGLTPEAIAVAGLEVSVSNLSAGVGFTINVYSPHGLDGTVRVHCTGA